MSDVRAPIWKHEAAPGPPQFEGVSALGARVRVHDKTGGVLAGPVVLGLGLVFCAVAAVVIVHGPIEAAIGPGFVGLLLAGIGLWSVVMVSRAARVVVVYESGFAALVRSKVTLWPWSEINAIVSDERYVRGKRTSYHVYSYEVCKRSGETVALDSTLLADVRPLIATVKEHVYARLRPPAQEEWDAGATLRFGAVSVDNQGIEARGRRLSWSDVRDVVVQHGNLIVTPKSEKPLKVGVSRISDVEILGALIGVDPEKMDLVRC